MKIAFGEEPNASAAQRIRAIRELLATPPPRVKPLFAPEIAALSEEELDADLKRSLEDRKRTNTQDDEKADEGEMAPDESEFPSHEEIRERCFGELHLIAVDASSGISAQISATRLLRLVAPAKVNLIEEEILSMSEEELDRDLLALMEGAKVDELVERDWARRREFPGG